MGNPSKFSNRRATLVMRKFSSWLLSVRDSIRQLTSLRSSVTVVADSASSMRSAASSALLTGRRSSRSSTTGLGLPGIIPSPLSGSVFSGRGRALFPLMPLRRGSLFSLLRLVPMSALLFQPLRGLHWTGWTWCRLYCYMFCLFVSLFFSSICVCCLSDSVFLVLIICLEDRYIATP